jgi:hypothetical protein
MIQPKLKEFIGILLLKSQNANTNVIAYEESIVLVKAIELQDATEKIEAFAKANECSYNTVLNETITICFFKIITVSEILRMNYKDNVKQLYAKSFDDIDTYISLNVNN